MTTSNQDLMKGVITAVDTLAAAGKLSPEQANQFIDYVFDMTVLRQNARTIKINAETYTIPKIGVGRRVTVPAVEAQDPGVRFGVTTGKIDLVPREIMTPFEISDLMAEINVEQGDVKDHVVRMMAAQLANDLEELYTTADLLGAAVLEGDIVPDGSPTLYIKDAFLALFNGWLRLGDSAHVVDAENANIGSGMFGAMLRAMPVKFLRNMRDLRWFMSPYTAQLWREKVSARATAAGDAALAGGAAMAPFGVQIVEVPLMPFEPKIVQHVVLNGLTPVALRYSHIHDVVVTASDLASTPTAAYSDVTDYAAVEADGTIARVEGSTIGDGATVKVTYQVGSQILLTHARNFVVGIGRDVRIEKDRNIYKRVDMYAITSRVSCGIEEVDALVKGVNIGLGT